MHHLTPLLILTLCATPALAQHQNLPARGICAHRGASHTHPENTLAAIDEAVRLGAQQIEIDIRQTSDGHLVLMHDATVTRTTDAAEKFPGRTSYRVTDFTLAELQTLDAGRWKEARFAGEKIPTLQAALARLPRNVWINLDVKGDARCTRQLADEIIELGRADQSIFSVRKGEMTAIQEYMQQHQVRLIINNMNRRPTPAQYIAETYADGRWDFFLAAPPIQFTGASSRLGPLRSWCLLVIYAARILRSTVGITAQIHCLRFSVGGAVSIWLALCCALAGILTSAVVLHAHAALIELRDKGIGELS
jgi:glycerophosphoryl diester phosphodiesterase